MRRLAEALLSGSTLFANISGLVCRAERVNYIILKSCLMIYSSDWISLFSLYNTENIDLQLHGHVKVKIYRQHSPALSGYRMLTLVMLNKLRCHTHF